MIIETISRSVHCDRCSNSTEGFSRFDTANYTMPTAKQIRDWADFHRIKSGDVFIDLCPACYAKYKLTKL